jgi:tetratricopeptide (TPR) repeat protein
MGTKHAFVPDKYRQIPLIVVLLMSGIFMTALAGSQATHREDSEDLGRQALKAGNYVEAEHSFRMALERVEREKLSDWQLVVALGNLAELLRSVEKYDESEKLFDRALTIRRAGTIADKRNLAVLLTELGRLHQETGHYALSESLLKEALLVTERDLGAQDPQMVQVWNGLGVLYTSIEKNKGAERAFKKAIALAENLANEPSALAPVLGDLALLYEQEKKWQLAEPVLLRALHVAETSFGPKHPETAAILTPLGVLYLRQERFPESERILRRSLEIRRKTLGPMHPSVALTSLLIGTVLTAKGQYEEARSLYEEALQSNEHNFGAKSVEVAMVLEEYAKLLHKLNNRQEASTMEARAKSIRTESEYVVKAPGRKIR